MTRCRGQDGLHQPDGTWGLYTRAGTRFRVRLENLLGKPTLIHWHGLLPPYGQDGDFTYEGLVGRYNADLANNLGNLASRVATVVTSKCDGKGPAPSADSPLAEAAATAVADATAAWNVVAPSRALEATWRLIRETNAYLEAREPWKLEPGAEVEQVLGDALEALRIVAILATPAIPTTTAEVWRRIGLTGSPAEQRLPGAAVWGGYPGGSSVEKGSPLFPRLAS